jgi:hypothetical protein
LRGIERRWREDVAFERISEARGQKAGDVVAELLRYADRSLA